MNPSAQGAAKVASHFIPTCWICDKAITLETCKIDEYGKGVHAECYAAKLAHPKRKFIDEKEERSWELCALANKERDPQKLLNYMQEINQLFEEIEKLKHSGHPPTDS
jgi:hypothetical protein